MALDMEICGPLIEISDQQVDRDRRQNNGSDDANRFSECIPGRQHKCQCRDA
ncbi:MAG: hypothetical protein A4E66_02652 [Syntrophus sp. PtaB.Bin001]|nr:MAG: hypothetical protein A4E66_02652 [Syntrophus sp. PtaB.Bin001]